MEPDEAVDALRDLRGDERSEILAVMDPAKATDLLRLLGYSEHEAGGFMTTAFLVASTTETVASLAARLAVHEDCPEELDAVALVDHDGRLVWDLPLLQLLVNPGQTRARRPRRRGRAGDRRHPRRRSPKSPNGSSRPGACRWSWSTTRTGRSAGSWPTTSSTPSMPERGRIHFPRLLQ